MESPFIVSSENDCGTKQSQSKSSRQTFVDLLNDPIPDSVTHASLKPTSILKPSHRDIRSAPIRRKLRVVTFRGENDDSSSDRRWNSIRDLDEVEKWSERTSVVTKADHLVHLDYGKELVDELINSLPCFGKENCKEAMSQDEFRPASEVLGGTELEFLEKLESNSDANARDIALARQSLFVKFDPLVKGASMARTDCLPMPVRPESEGNLLVLDTPERIAKRSTKAPSPSAPDIPSALPPRMQENLMGSASPALASVPIPQPSKNVQSPKGIDRLLFQRSEDGAVVQEDRVGMEDGKEEPVGASELIDVLMYTRNDLERRVEEAVKEAIEEMKKKHLADKDQLQKENDTLNEERLKLGKELEKTKDFNEWRKALSKYKKTIPEFTKLQENTVKALVTAKETQESSKAEFDSVETSFSDLHKRYERVKALHEDSIKDGDEMRSILADYKDRLSKSEQKYRTIKAQSEEKLASCSAEVERVQKAKDSEMAFLQTHLKKEQLKIARLEKDLLSKDQEMKEMSSICDELMKQLGERQG